ncbi:HNH endonuclease [Spirosoma harenae]
MTLDHLFPVVNNGLCACGCGKLLTGRQTRWTSEKCQERALDIYLLVKGDTREIRRQVFDRDKGVCAHCGEVHQIWHADHIIPVYKGGGYCDLDNFQTLCVPCHVAKGSSESSSECQISLYSQQAASTFVKI